VKTRWLGFGVSLAAVVAAISLAGASEIACGQAEISDSGGDATWTRAFAAAGAPSAQGQIGNEGRLITDLRFSGLLKFSFPQKQQFWKDHGKFTPLPDVIYSFVATGFSGGGNAILDQDRYVTIDGCVGGVCNAIKGMLWIDTRAEPAILIFVGTEMANSSGCSSSDCLWVFSSVQLNQTQLPHPFLTSVHRWLAAFQNYTWNEEGYRFSFAKAKLVQPTGEMIELAPSVLNVPRSEIATK
jgi:hypothetical protein